MIIVKDCAGQTAPVKSARSAAIGAPINPAAVAEIDHFFETIAAGIEGAGTDTVDASLIFEIDAGLVLKTLDRE